MSTRLVVSDSSPLIYLAKAGGFVEAHRVLGALGVPPVVWRESVEAGEARGRPDAAAIRDAAGAGMLARLAITPGQERDSWSLGQKFRIGVGESQAIVLARKGAGLLMDDDRAAGVAESLGLAVTPTMSVPVLGVKRRVLTTGEALALLDRLSKALAIPSAKFLAARQEIEEVRA